jgi:putative inorganic carbon (HCO3(-)) transporter
MDASRYYLKQGSITEILLLILASIALLGVIKGYKLTITAGTILLLSFFFVCCTSWLFSKTDIKELKDIIRVAEYLCIYIIIGTFTVKNKCRNSFLIGFFAGSFAAVCIALIHWHVGPKSIFLLWGPEWASSYTASNFRVYGSFGNPLNLTGYISTVGALSIAMLPKQKLLYKRFFYLMLIFGSVITLIVTGSKSSLILFGILLIKNKKIKFIIINLIIIVVGFYFVSKLGNNHVLERIFSIFNKISEGSNIDLQRHYVWLSSLEMIKDNPLIGVGLGNFAEIYNKSYFLYGASTEKSTFTAENMFLEIGAEVGLIGLIFIIILLVRAVCLGYKDDNYHHHHYTTESISLKDLATAVLAFTLVGMIQSMSAASLNITLFSLMGVQDGIIKSRYKTRKTSANNHF